MAVSNVKSGNRVNLPYEKIRKVKYLLANGQVRYALRTFLEDDRKVVRFVSKAVWDSLDEPEEHINLEEKKRLEERAKGTSRAEFEAVLKKIRSVEPDDEDQWK